ncbi:hypothetical protein HY469_04680 [Candidatus Roizmanbacteria bacterium]|nr:hypothetical protein [Candidatus Roizmanbacteria bacterium]
MREFYSRGTFLFHKTGIPVTDLPETLRTAYEPYSDDNNNIILLFTSPKLVSIDVLVDDTLFENKPVELTQKDDETVMIFIKPLDDMKLANGFLDYHDIDKSLTENKKWLSVTAVSK